MVPITLLLCLYVFHACAYKQLRVFVHYLYALKYTSVSAHTHIRTVVCTRIYTRTHNKRTTMHVYSLERRRAHPLAHSRIPTRTRILIHSRIHTRIQHTHVCAYTHTCSHTHAYTHNSSRTYSYEKFKIIKLF